VLSDADRSAHRLYREALSEHLRADRDNRQIERSITDQVEYDAGPLAVRTFSSWFE